MTINGTFTATREPIYSALWALITKDPGVTSVFATMRRAAEIAAEQVQPECPALYMIQRAETWERPGRGIPPKRTLRSDLLVYTRDADPSTPPSYALNVLLDYLDFALGDPGNPNFVQTLGGLVHHVYIEGDLRLTEAATFQELSIAVVPIAMLIP